MLHGNGTAEWLESLPEDERNQIIDNIIKSHNTAQAIYDNHQSVLAADTKRRENDGVAADEAEKEHAEKEACMTLEEGVEEWTPENVVEKGIALTTMNAGAAVKRAILKRQWMFQKGWAEKAKKTVGAMPPPTAGVTKWLQKLQDKLHDRELQAAITKLRAETHTIEVCPPLDINLSAIPAQVLVSEEVMQKRGREIIESASFKARCTKHKREDHRDASLWFITPISFCMWFTGQIWTLGGERQESGCAML